MVVSQVPFCIVFGGFAVELGDLVTGVMASELWSAVLADAVPVAGVEASVFAFGFLGSFHFSIFPFAEQ